MTDRVMQPRAADARPSVAAGFARALVELAVQRGADRLELARRARLCLEDLDDLNRRVPLDRYRALMATGKELTRDPALALHFGQAFDMAELSLVGLLGRSVTGIQEALVLLNKYAPLLTDIATLGPDRFAFARDRRGLWFLDMRADPNDFPEISESSFARMRTMGLRLAEDAPRWKEIRFTHPAPSYANEYEAVFGVPVLFSSDRNGVLFDPAAADYHFSVQPRYVLDLLQPHADSLLAELQRARTSRARVECALLSHFPTGAVAMEKVASELGLSRATLLRRLQAEGTTFEQVLNQLRLRLAWEYLQEQIPIADIAHRLGYSDSAAFSRAFKRWTGTTPRAARDRGH